MGWDAWAELQGGARHPGGTGVGSTQKRRGRHFRLRTGEHVGGEQQSLKQMLKIMNMAEITFNRI
jgi:hypothetical protein